MMLYWRDAVRLTCGDPAAGTITVWQPVWDAASRCGRRRGRQRSAAATASAAATRRAGDLTTVKAARSGLRYH